MAYVADPVEVSPDHYELLLENDAVRVLRMTLGPGDIDEEHSHPSETVYFLKGGKLRIHLPEGDPAELEIPDGGVIWHEPWTHRVENVGSSDVEAVIVESKTT
jgi:quercetin dioxygenase-like cupin family protein